MKIISKILLVILPIFLYDSCKKDKPVIPGLTTAAVTEMTYTTATSGGNVINEGSAPLVSMGICWNTSAEPTIYNSKTIESVKLGVFKSTLTELNPNTMYYIRSYATNSAGTGYGDQVSFTTTQVELPALSTTEVTSITQTTAISGGSITTENGGQITVSGICWGITENPTIVENKTTDGTGSGSFISNVTGLQPGIYYYVRAYATNSAGTAYGNNINFTTSPGIPSLTTTAIKSIASISALSGGTITSNGGISVTEQGICWSAIQKPSIADNNISNSISSGIFLGILTGLTPNTTYYIRAYATNSLGTAYGNELSFLTNPIVADIDGNNYNTVTIDTKTWMAENLKTTHYNDGTTIPLVTDESAWSNLTTPGYCCYNNDLAKYFTTYGLLYNWYAVNTGKLCPSGWHVPTYDERWSSIKYLGDNGYNYDGTTSGNKTAKALAATTNWAVSTNAGAVGNNLATNNSSGFAALPGGFRENDGSFYLIGQWGRWWDNYKDPWNFVYGWEIYYDKNSTTSNGYILMRRGSSVRCLKD
jgi:uncharacterized protein (TIGR02145 family)